MAAIDDLKLLTSTHNIYNSLEVYCGPHTVFFVFLIIIVSAIKPLENKEPLTQNPPLSMCVYYPDRPRIGRWPSQSANGRIYHVTY